MHIYQMFPNLYIKTMGTCLCVYTSVTLSFRTLCLSKQVATECTQCLTEESLRVSPGLNMVFVNMDNLPWVLIWSRHPSQQRHLAERTENTAQRLGEKPPEVLFYCWNSNQTALRKQTLQTIERKVQQDGDTLNEEYFTVLRVWQLQHRETLNKASVKLLRFLIVLNVLCFWYSNLFYKWFSF